MKKAVSMLLTGLVVWSLTAAAPGASAQESLPTTALKLNSASRKVPAGTLLSIGFNTLLDSRITQVGEPFMASLQQDFVTEKGSENSRVILPKGTLIRGRVDQVRKPGLFSRGGSILLSFDHVVLPSGDLLPLDLNLSARNDSVKRVRQSGDPDGQYALYSDPGVGYKIHKGFESGVKTYDKFKQAGIEGGKDIAGGAGIVVTVPAAVVGGVVAGTAVTAGKGVQALLGRGETALIEPGDTVNIDFGGAFNLPAE